MNEYWLMYLVTRTFVLHTLSIVGIIFSLILVLAGAITIAVLTDDFGKKFKEAYRIVRRIFWCAIGCLILSICLFLLAPSKEDAVIIAGGGAILSTAPQEKIDKLSKLLDIKLDKVLEAAEQEAKGE